MLMCFSKWYSLFTNIFFYTSKNVEASAVRHNSLFCQLPPAGVITTTVLNPGLPFSFISPGGRMSVGDICEFTGKARLNVERFSLNFRHKATGHCVYHLDFRFNFVSGLQFSVHQKVGFFVKSQSSKLACVSFCYVKKQSNMSNNLWSSNMFYYYLLWWNIMHAFRKQS